MWTAIWKAGISLTPVIGLLVFAGMLCSAGSAWAQLQCPLPEGVAPPMVPRITAQQVEDGSASLADFAVAARGQEQESPTVEQAAHAGCLLRQEGGPWRSGSTYLIQLTPDGRVFVHAKDMSLSGRQLNAEIYGAILLALGIDPTALSDPGAAVAAFAAAAQGDGGLFEVPGVPGASGYASAYNAASVVLAGFDAGESHLVPVSEENIDHGNPPVAAEDVVDRTTLKAFGTAAGEYAIELLESGDLAALSKARVALRNPDGPWRHDPVYLGVTDRNTELILFHGAFPDRFEFRQGGVARDVATGELVFDQLVAAAESGPEGGFWLYHFDSPVDDTDSEDIPKLGYARIVTANIPLPDGSILQSDFIINTGFYLTSDSVYVRRLLGALGDGQASIMFAVTAPGEGDAVEGSVAVMVEGAPTDTVHFVYRLAGAADQPFTYAGAATNREAMASFAWDTLELPDDDYELAALYTEDDGQSVVYDVIAVSVDNVDDDGNGGGGGGGCASAPVLPGGGGPMDPTLPVLVGLVAAWLVMGRLPVRQAWGVFEG